MTGFQPRLWPTIITLVMVAILIGLGSWQLQRRVWKTDLLATIAERMNAAPVDIPADIDDPKDWRFRNAVVTGHFANDRALHLYGRTLDGKAGVHLLVPLIRDDGSAILVDRGFVPFVHGGNLADYSNQEGRSTVTGVVRLPEPPGWFLPSANPALNIWYAVDMPAMSAKTGLTLAPIYIAARPLTAAAGFVDGGSPIATGGTEGAGIRNEHLNYAIFWFGMAVALIVIYVMSSWRGASRARTS
jgi:surfeit locus 1 family protein